MYVRSVSEAERREVKHKSEPETLCECKCFTDFTFCYIIRFIFNDLLTTILSTQTELITHIVFCVLRSPLRGVNLILSNYLLVNLPKLPAKNRLR